MFKNWDPGRVVISFKGSLILGIAKGTFVNVERSEDAFSTDTGSNGDVTRVRNRNRTGTVTVTIQAASPSNAVLTTYALADEQFGLGSGAIQVEDLNGTMLAHGENAWIRKLPAAEGAAEASDREWVFEVAELELTLAGATF
jgi:hypothetical protein